MVKSENRKPGSRMPCTVLRVIGGRRLRLMFKHSTEGYADGVTTRIAPRIPERSDLLQLNSLEAGFLKELPSGCFFQGLVFVHEPARKGPKPFERLASPSDEQDSRATLRAMKEDHVYRYRRSRMVVAVFFLSLSFLHQTLESLVQGVFSQATRSYNALSP